MYNTINLPLYQQLYNSLKQRIESGEFTPGSMLPSEAKIRIEYNVSQITIRRALQELVNDGLVERRHGMGTFVNDPQKMPAIVGMSSFTPDVASGKLKLRRTLITNETINATESVADKLKINAGDPVKRLVRLDYEKNLPFSLDDVYIPLNLSLNITSEIAADPLFLSYWETNEKIKITRSKYEIHIDKPSSQEQQLLQITPDDPILVVTELLFMSKHHPAAWIISRYRSDRCRLSGSVMLR